MTRHALSAVLALALGMLVVGAAGIAAAAPPAMKPSSHFEADSKNGMIVMLVEPQRQFATYDISIYKLDPATLKWDYGPLRGWSQLTLDDRAVAQVYVASFITPPGTYAIAHLRTQGLWFGCYNGGTKMLEVKPGVVTFVGRFDPNPSLEQMRQELPPMVRGQKYQQLFDTPRPAITPPEDMLGWREDLTAYLRQAYPEITAPLEAATLKDTTFQTSRGLLQGEICDRY